jgi:ribosome-associated translation inhibitor RaiA
MEIPLQITFRGFAHQPALDELIRKRVLALEKVARHPLTSCHVVVELGREHIPGARMFHVHVDVAFAGAVVAINHEPRDNHAHEDAKVAVHDAFEAVERRIEHADHRRHAAS